MTSDNGVEPIHTQAVFCTTIWNRA